MTNNSSACGKIILSGEYAVVFGYPGIAVPAPLRIRVTLEEDSAQKGIRLEFRDMSLKSQVSSLNTDWNDYAMNIVDRCATFAPVPSGTITIESQIPLGKGMGASTALVIAVVRCLVGDDKKKAKEIEDAVNPGHSGIDFEVIWNERPIKFTKGSDPEFVDLPKNATSNFSLIDTGSPDQQTPELIAWVTERKDELSDVFASIGACTDRLLSVAEDRDLLLRDIIRDHHKAQCSLGIVTDKAKNMITKIEQEGGAAKVIGAGSRTGGCGMVLVFGIEHPRIEELTSRILVS